LTLTIPPLLHLLSVSVYNALALWDITGIERQFTNSPPSLKKIAKRETFLGRKVYLFIGTIPVLGCGL
jgi:hypothetical protein